MSSGRFREWTGELHGAVLFVLHSLGWTDAFAWSHLSIRSLADTQQWLNINVFTELWESKKNTDSIEVNWKTPTNTEWTQFLYKQTLRRWFHFFWCRLECRLLPLRRYKYLCKSLPWLTGVSAYHTQPMVAARLVSALSGFSVKLVWPVRDLRDNDRNMSNGPVAVGVLKYPFSTRLPLVLEPVLCRIFDLGAL